jgi:hypothetical protein
MELRQLWVNGRSITISDAGPVLRVGPAADEWVLQAQLGHQSPFAVTYALAMQLPDGRMLHGRARLASAEGDRLCFEGLGPLGGTIEPAG